MKERNSYGSNSFIRVFLGLSVLTLLFMGCPESDSDDSNGDPTAPTHEEKIAAFVAEHGTILNKNNTTVTGTDYAAVEAALAALDEAFPGSTSSDVAGYKTQLSGLKTTINEINAAAGKIDMFNTAIDDAASDAEVEAALIALLGDEALLPEGNGLANKERYLALSSINYSNGKTSLTKGALDAIVPQLEAGIQVIVKLEEGIKKLTPHDKIPVAVDAANIVAYYKALLDVSISGTEYYGITVTAAGTWTVTLSLNSYKAVSGSLSLTAIASLSGDLWFGADNADVFKDKTTLTQADVDIIMKLEPDHLKLAHNVTAIKGKVEISSELFNGTVLQPTLQPTFAIPGGRSIMLTGGSSLHFLGGTAGDRGHSVLFSGDGEYKNTSGEEILVERYIDASKLHFKLKIKNDSDPDKGLELPAGGGVYFREIQIENTVDHFKFALKGPGIASVVTGDVVTLRNDVIEHNPMILQGGAEIFVSDGINLYTSVNVYSGSKITVNGDDKTMILNGSNSIILSGDSTSPGMVILNNQSGTSAAGGGAKLFIPDGGSDLGSGGDIVLPAPSADLILTGETSGNGFTAPAAAATAITGLSASPQGFKSIQAATSFTDLGKVTIQGGESGTVTLDKDSTIATE